MLALPIPPDVLAKRLSRNLGPRRDGLELHVTQVQLKALGAAEALLKLQVTATTHADPKGQRWEVSIPLGPIELHPDVTTSALFITLRANLEEWWDVREAEPDIAAMGRRLS
jgi:hypothetical protein